MKIFVHSEGSRTTKGPYSIEQIKEMAALKQIGSNELFFIEGTFKWIPINQLFENAQLLSSSDLKQVRTLSPSTVKEYKRVCQQCGKIWHSLVARENQIVKNIKFNSCSMGLQACTCSPIGNAGAAQSNRSIEANQSELVKLRSCPVCNSTFFTQEIISYETKELLR